MFFLNPLSYLDWKSRTDRTSSEPPFESSKQNFSNPLDETVRHSSQQKAIDKVEQIRQVYPLERRIFL